MVALAARAADLAERTGAWVPALLAMPSAIAIAHPTRHAPNTFTPAVCQVRSARWNPAQRADVARSAAGRAPLRGAFGADHRLPGGDIGLDAVNVEGGMESGVAAGRPLVAEASAPPQVR